MPEALGVMFDTAPVLAGKDSFDYPSVGYTEIFGYEAKAQAEVYQEQVRSLLSGWTVWKIRIKSIR